MAKKRKSRAAVVAEEAGAKAPGDSGRPGLVVGIFAWLVVRGEGGGSGTGQYLQEPAPDFTLPTIAGDQVSLADHVGRHNLLLYFNEGIG